MGASSVTGISGVGAVRGMKGPGNNRNFWVSNVCPHVVAAGSATLASGTVTVVFPRPLAGAAADYVVQVTAGGCTGATAVTGILAVKTEASSKMTGITITGTGDHEVMWLVVNKGFGMEATVPDARP